jgi:hypothetical protein
MEDSKVAVLLEDLLSKFRTFGEGLVGLSDQLKEFREETNNRFSCLEQKLTNHILENREEHKQLMQMIQELDKEVQVEIKRVK